MYNVARAWFSIACSHSLFRVRVRFRHSSHAVWQTYIRIYVRMARGVRHPFDSLRPYLRQGIITVLTASHFGQLPAAPVREFLCPRLSPIVNPLNFNAKWSEKHQIQFNFSLYLSFNILAPRAGQKRAQNTWKNQAWDCPNQRYSERQRSLFLMLMHAFSTCL